MEKKYCHLFYVPFTGLGLYGGFRGNRWLKNRIQIFKQFVTPSLQAQTNKNFILWVSWRFQEKNNKLVKELKSYLDEISEFRTIFTFNGVCFYDDKYSDLEARNRLLSSIHGSMSELINITAGYDYILMTIQPSDDLYHRAAVEGIQSVFEKVPELQAFGFKNGYIINYNTKELAEYNPSTNPPFYTIKFDRETFIDPLKHTEYTSLKHDIIEE